MSQSTQILEHLKTKPLTPLEALRDYGTFRLAARIAELRSSGHVIYTDIVERSGKRIASYRLSL